MPWWKYLANRFLTGLENLAFGLALSEYHTGYRAYRREVLETVAFTANSDRFLFDQEILAQGVAAGFRIVEVPVPTRYFPEASSAGFWPDPVRLGSSAARPLSRPPEGLWRQRRLRACAAATGGRG